MSLSLRVRARRGDFDLDVTFETDARALAVIGPSGAGKTTLLQGLAGLIATDETRLNIDGEAVVDTAAGFAPPAYRRGVGYVFQDGRLFPHMTVGGNVGFALSYAKDPLSVAEALLLDEPFAGLDDERRQAVIPYLIRLRDKVGVPMILVSHDERDVSALAQSVMIVDRGRLRSEG